ncbi:hypothetical protein JNUCC42_22475 [Brevibacterium sp. JNUCC-42]|nr:hypothetical protein JNUCC42_22475 [Brevibacterium sp. JNUCC-42]
MKPDPISDDRTPLTSSEYFFSYTRQVNGIPFPDDYIRVVVSPNGTIVSYSFNWSEDLILPPDTKKKFLEEAAKIFKESPFLTLIYNVPYRKETEIIEPRLVYDYETSLAIDAITGQSVEKPSESIPDASNKHILVTEKPLAPLHNGPPLTQTQAEELAKKALQLKDWKVTQVSYQEKNTNKRALWYLSFEKNAQKESAVELKSSLMQ